MYGKEPILAMDDAKKISLMNRLLDITDKVPQLRTNARRTIAWAQAKLEETFKEKGNSTQFHKEELVLYFDKAKVG